MTEDLQADELIKAFKALDRNADNVVTLSEINAVVTAARVPRSVAELACLFKQEFDSIKALHKSRLAADSPGITMADMNELVKMLVGQKDRIEATANSSAAQAHRRRYERIATPAELARIARDIIGRMRELSGCKITLYGDGHDPDQAVVIDAIQQGGIGNCYFLAALGSIVWHHRRIIQRMIKDNFDGTYTVTFAGARTEPVTVKAPTVIELALYTTVSQWGFWPAVIEKAYGVYNSTMSFSPSRVPAENTSIDNLWVDLFALLTGQESTLESLSTCPADRLEQILDSAFREKRAVVAGSKATCSVIPGNHAYSVIGWDRSISRITLRNPWGAVNGAEPLHDDGLAFDGDLDGIFSMDLDHFYDCFDHVTYERWSSRPEGDRYAGTGGEIHQQEVEFDKDTMSLVDRSPLSIFGRLSMAALHIVSGLLLVVLSASFLSFEQSTLSWPVTMGTIENPTERVEPTSFARSISPFDVWYAFTVGGRQYRSSMYGGLTDYVPIWQDPKLTRSYAVGQAVPVHYNPQDPHQSCLRPGCNLSDALIMLALIIGGTLQVALGVQLARSQRLFREFGESAKSVRLSGLP